jgi:hypothetical protein
MDTSYNCGADDVNVVAFTKAVGIIGAAMPLKNFSPAVSGRLAEARSLKWK